MISDYMMQSITRNFENRTKPAFQARTSRQPSLGNTNRSLFTKEFIKQQLPNLIRKQKQGVLQINNTQPKSPSPISKSRLKVMLDRQSTRSVVKRNGSTKILITDQSKSKLLHKRSIINDYSQQNENKTIQYYRERRKTEKQNDITQIVQRRLWKQL